MGNMYPYMTVYIQPYMAINTVCLIIGSNNEIKTLTIDPNTEVNAGDQELK